MVFPFKFKTGKPKLIDFYCKAGGCSRGYYEAGFEVFGVDIEPQKNYPFPFFQGDAIEFIRLFGHLFDVCHASPPCQFYTVAKSINGTGKHLDLVAKTRAALISTGKPYVIENVPGAPLLNPLVLCGTMFEGLRVVRHRLFETSPAIWFPPQSCECNGKRKTSKRGVISSFETGDYITVVGHNFIVADARRAMGIDWMIGSELSQAIPPAYTKFIGEQLLKQLGSEKCQNKKQKNYSYTR